MIATLILSCCTIEKYREQIEMCQKTWCNREDINTYFFSGEKCGGKCGEKVIHLEGVGDDYPSAGYKQWLGLRWLYEKHPHSKFYYIAGSDTYCRYNKILEYLGEFNSDDYLYIGGHGDYRNLDNEKIYFHSGGPGFFISNSLMKYIYPLIPKWIEECNIKIEWCDVSIAYLFHKLSSEIKIKTIISDKFRNCNWEGKCYGYYQCCESKKNDFDNLWVCHNMSSEDMIYLYNLNIR